MIISLVGYMGSGKSHISKLLSTELHYKLLDLDKEISLKLKETIPEIFQNNGEIYFRKQEKEILHQLLEETENSILSVGGGTPTFYDNMDAINKYSTSFFLRTDIKTLTDRISKNKERRPLLARIPDEDLPEFIAKHLFERNSFYSQANFIIDTKDKSPEELVKEIILKVHGY
ncbi:shikimate kinase [Frigoriflavimonas asaccharolytica]|uniref:Shikimate kinase n=1 Tax=Frigoriflavimonas asaccharolytica TaxID=2735899 RepID=A0A8J8K7R9_9FLAO|nr:shikimate kinase [Frigoriflavimonas asaccharolytica]NRS92328.1 shikimate kinase [Frigoriflavimonas asaccharolytica]